MLERLFAIWIFWILDISSIAFEEFLKIIAAAVTRGTIDIRTPTRIIFSRSDICLLVMHFAPAGYRKPSFILYRFSV
jgi:hypothetical protein